MKYQKGDLVKLAYEEQDIETIPSGTEILLVKAHPDNDNPNSIGTNLWYGDAVINGRMRYVLVYENNLTLIESALSRAAKSVLVDLQQMTDDEIIEALDSADNAIAYVFEGMQD